MGVFDSVCISEAKRRRMEILKFKKLDKSGSYFIKM